MLKVTFRGAMLAGDRKSFLALKSVDTLAVSHNKSS